VRCAGHDDVRLYFDTETWLLVKAEAEVPSPEDGEDTTLELFPAQYRKVHDVKEPTRIALRYGERTLRRVSPLGG